MHPGDGYSSYFYIQGFRHRLIKFTENISGFRLKIVVVDNELDSC